MKSKQTKEKNKRLCRSLISSCLTTPTFTGKGVRRAKRPIYPKRHTFQTCLSPRSFSAWVRNSSTRSDRCFSSLHKKKRLAHHALHCPLPDSQCLWPWSVTFFIINVGGVNISLSADVKAWPHASFRQNKMWIFTVGKRSTSGEWCRR